MPTSGANTTILQPNPRAGGQPVPPLIMPGQSSQPAPGGNPSNNNQGQNTITIEDDVTVSGPSAGLNGTPQPSGPSPGGNAQPTTPGTDYNGAVVGMAPGAVAPEQNQPSGNANGWRSSGSDWYYIDPVTNSMVKGWKEINGFWYYFDPVTGIMARGWKAIEKKDQDTGEVIKKWYYLFPFAGDDDGKMLTGWQYINDEWYFLETAKGDGQMIIGWKSDNDVWYYLFPDGVMAHDGWVYINEKWYYFNSSGAMQAEAIIDYNGKKYYVDENGAMLTSKDAEVINNGGTVECGGIVYEVDEDGGCTAISTSSGTAPATASNANIGEWRAYITNNSEISAARKTILLKSFDTIESGCIYHQLRATDANETPDACLVDGCTSKKHPGQVGAYNFRTMARYNLETPLYLDCSYFVKHCYWKADKHMSSSRTSDMRKDFDFFDITKDQLLPADIAIKPKHVKLFVGYTSDGQMVWSEMKNHANNGVVSAHSLSNSYVLRRYNKGLD